MFAMQHFGVTADIMSLAKGIASGMPLGATIAPAKIMNWEAGSHASTFGGNPLSCQAAMATIELLENNMMKNAANQGKRLIESLREMQKTYECMGDVRGKGLMVAVELVKDRHTKAPATEWRSRIIKKTFEKGLLLLGCGENSIRFSPSLSITSNEVDTGLSIFEESVREVAG
jgi:4-aminobutyrate aminotransferase